MAYTPSDELGAVPWRDWHLTVWRRYKLTWFDRHFRLSAPAAIILFALSVVANYYAGAYATERASNSVTDLILSNIPVIDVDWYFVYGAISLIVLVAIILIIHPRRIPFALHAMALFYFTRAVFVTLTHLGPFPMQAPLDFQSQLILHAFGGGDEFFSGHTGAPFMLALIFWHERPWRWFFLACSTFFGIIVLLGHYHYSIDVLSAFFITYSIYHLALWLFPKERAIFRGDELASELAAE